MKIRYFGLVAMVLLSDHITAATISGKTVDTAGGPVIGIQNDAYLFNTKTGAFEFKASGVSDGSGKFTIPELMVGKYMMITNPIAQSGAAILQNAWSQFGPFWNQAESIKTGYPIVTYKNVCDDPKSTCTSKQPTFIDIRTASISKGVGDIILPASETCRVQSPIDIEDVSGLISYTSFSQDYSVPNNNPVPYLAGIFQELKLTYNLTDVPGLTAGNELRAQPMLYAVSNKGILFSKPLGSFKITVAGSVGSVTKQKISIPDGLWTELVTTKTDSWALNVGIQFMEYNPTTKQEVSALCNPLLFPVQWKK